MTFSVHLTLSERAQRLARQVLPEDPQLPIPDAAPLPAYRDQMVFGDPPGQLVLEVFRRRFHCSETGIRLELLIALPAELDGIPPDLAPL